METHLSVTGQLLCNGPLRSLSGRFNDNNGVFAGLDLQEIKISLSIRMCPPFNLLAQSFARQNLWVLQASTCDRFSDHAG